MLTVIENMSQNIINENETLIAALEKLDKSRVKVIFVVDSDGKLMASVTDGDVRRALLAGSEVNSRVGDIGFRSPQYMTKTDGMDKISAALSKKDIAAIPVVDGDGRIECIYTNKGPQKRKSDVKIDVPVVIMAGGKGTRLYPYTKILPKALLPVADTPIIERIINSFIECGCENYHIVINHMKNMIRAYFSDNDKKDMITFWDEDIPLGTGGGLKMLENTVTGTFALTNCDILILDDVRNMVEHHKKNNNSVTMVCSLKTFEIPYGVVNFSSGGEIASFEEKPTLSYFTNTGYYILEPEVFKYINENEFIGMPDIIERMRADGKKIGVYPIGENAWLDMGQFDSMEGMERRLKELEL